MTITRAKPLALTPLNRHPGLYLRLCKQPQVCAARENCTSEIKVTFLNTISDRAHGSKPKIL